VRKLLTAGKEALEQEERQGGEQRHRADCPPHHAQPEQPRVEEVDARLMK
jgi:hypothetical protein